MKSELMKNRTTAVVMGTSWCIALLALVYTKVREEERFEEREEFLKTRIEVKVCQEKAGTLVKEIVDRENQLRRSLAQLENALGEARLAKEFAQEQSKRAIKRK
jgi:hypothetical protein